MPSIGATGSTPAATPATKTPPASTPSPSSNTADSVTLSDAAKASQSGAKTETKKPEEKGWFRKILDYVGDSMLASQRIDMQAEMVKMHLDPSWVQEDCSIRTGK